MVRDRWRSISEKLRFERDWSLIILAIGIGVVMSGVAMAFILPLHALAHYGEELLSEGNRAVWWIVPLSPIAGALLCGIVLRLIPGGEGEGPGVSKVMYCIHRMRGQVRWYVVFRKWLASTFTIASGGSAGAEGPIVTIGAAIGSNIGSLLGVTPQNRATLLGCAAAAGISSVFNAPIAGVFFVLEILLRDFSLRTFTPIVVASVISTAVTQAVLDDEPLFATLNLSIEQAFHWAEIPNYLVLGLVCGTFAAIFVRVLYLVMDAFARVPMPLVFRPMVGATVLGLIGLAYLFISSDPGLPPFYGNGYPVVAELLDQQHYYDDSGTLLSMGTMFTGLVAIALLKGVATCLTLGTGGAGGVFAPSLVLGAATGGAFGMIVNSLGWGPAASPAHYALVGMAAMVAATTHAPLTAILIVYEVTHRYEVILPLMLAAVISTIVSRIVHRESIYTVKLAKLGVRVGEMSDLTILRRLTVNDVPLVAPVFVHPEDSAQKLLVLSEKLSAVDFIVTDNHNRYLGMVTGTDLKEALVYREAIPLLQVSELQRSDLPTVMSDETIDVVLDKFVAHDVNALAVLNEQGNQAVLGLITRSRLMRRYQLALEEA